jgi:caa(3)-type oxidase subunit IV
MAHDQHHHHPPYEQMLKEYMKVFTILCVFTIITVVAAEKHFIPTSWGMTGIMINLIIGLAIATFKVFKVMQIFMHLRFDNKYLRAFVFVPVFLFFVMIFALTQLENFHHP